MPKVLLLFQTIALQAIQAEQPGSIPRVRDGCSYLRNASRATARAALDSRSNTQSKSHASNSQAEPRPHTRCITSATLACIRHAFTSALSAANTSHVTRHTSHVTRHTSHVTRHPHQRCKARAAHLHCNSAHAKQPHFAQTPAATPS